MSVPAFETQAAVNAEVVPEATKTMQILGYYEPGDGGGCVAVRTDSDPGNLGFRTADRETKSGGGADPINGGFWIKKINRSLNIRQLGARAYGKDFDNYALIQEALEEGYEVIIPPAGDDRWESDGAVNAGQYYVSQPLVSGRVGQRIMSASLARGNIDVGPMGTLYTDYQGPLLKCQHEAMVIYGVSFEGVGTGGGYNGIQCLKTANTDDMDISIIDCSFFFFDAAIEHYGRGLRARGNNFALNHNSILQKWPTSGVAGTDPITQLPYGRRAHEIYNNRFHDVHDAIVIDGAATALFRDAIIALNQLDKGDTLFRGGGINLVMVGNQVANTSDVAVWIKDVWQDCIINGLKVTGDLSDLGHHPPAGYGIYTECDVVRSQFTNCNLRSLSRSGMRFNGNVDGCNISNNIISGTGRSGIGSDGCISFAGGTTVHKTNISHNDLNRHSTATRLISSNSTTFIGTKILGNTRDVTLANSALISGAATFSGSDNEIQP